MLEEELANAAQEGKLRTLDGRWIPISSAHIAIAMLLQAGEACIMKKAMVLAAPQLYELGAEFVLWVHDEFQVECAPEYEDNVGAILVSSMRRAGEEFGLRVKIDGEYKVGKNWGETH
jgi:DNA polymerase I-like protein with 3'-5' exonuclease and polymerase domains